MSGPTKLSNLRRGVGTPKFIADHPEVQEALGTSSEVGKFVGPSP